MEFKNWFFEIANLNQSIDVQFTQEGSGYNTTFQVGQNTYQVELHPLKLTMQSQPYLSISNVWNVSFHRQSVYGQKEYSPTYENKGTYEVYTNILSILGKLIQTKGAAGFMFTAASSAQNLIYHKLAKKYSQDFTEIQANVFIRKDVLRQKIQALNNTDKVSLYANIAANNRKKRHFIGLEKEEKNVLREKFRTLSSLKNKVASFNSLNRYITGYILNVNLEYINILYINPVDNTIKSEKIAQHLINAGSIVETPAENAKYLINRIKTDPFYSKYIQ